MSTKTRAPEVIKGSHLTVTKYKTGQVTLEWDWDALTHEVKAATLAYESKQELNAEKVEKKAKKDLVKVTETKVTKTRAKKAEEKVSPTKDSAKKAPAKKPAAKKTTTKAKK